MTAIPIVALDFPTEAQALELVDGLGPLCRFYKVGSELFTAVGPAIITRLRERGAEVFLDLKFHDIPNTVGGAVRSAGALGVRLVTVHASGGEAMLRAAMRAALDYAHLEVLAVTVLTSLDPSELGAAWGRADRVDASAEVLRLSGVAVLAGVHGIVCSGHEARLVRARYRDIPLLVPGVRLAGGAAGDQRRVVTPAEAAEAGAKYVVLGRTVTASPDRRAAMAEAVRQLA